ncbi:MAG: hypothetical protein BMS9Abin17_0045 [Acidimicrobiia bacterium]|nr:MAG: hypothetical protein BMS9Abin17_0045 [Acidimicrobiia bacterium]
MRRVALLVSLMMVAAACASGPQTAAVDGSANSPATTTPGSSDETGAQGATPAPGEAVDLFPRPEGPSAPDFTMALASGESFTLSNEQKPVYMIFWAEW